MVLAAVGTVLDEAWVNLLELLQVQQISTSPLFTVLVLLVVGFVGGRIFSEVLRRILKMTALDDLAVKSNVQLFLRRIDYRGELSDFIAGVAKWLIYALTVLAVFHVFGLSFFAAYSELLIRGAWRAVFALLVLIVGVIVSQHIEYVVRQLFRGGRIRGMVDKSNAEIPVYMIAGRIARYLGYSVTTLIVLALLGLNFTLLAIVVALFGLGLVVSFAFSTRDLTRNIAISIYFQLSRVFQAGDHIMIDGCEGRIVGIRPLYTKIEADDGQTYYVPNTRVLNEIVGHEGG